MRGALLSTTLLLVAACGSGGATKNTLFGGFEPRDGAAVIFAPTSCDIPFVGESSVSGVAIVLGDYADVCNVIGQTQLCGTKASSTSLLAAAIAGVVGTDPVGPAGPGTYTFMTEPPTGSFRAASADAAQVDASCKAGDSGDRDAAGGSITIDAVTADRVTGKLDLRFDFDEAYQEPFDVAICAVTIDLCSALFACFDHACVQ
jgi:hypothetical protein